MASGDGLVSVESAHSVKDTIDRLEASLKSAGITVFARIDHAAGAQAAGLSLRPTQVLIFGNPKAGTLLMQSRQAIGLDLPLRAVAWEDLAGKVRLTYTDVAWLARRYRLGQETEGTLAMLAIALEKFVAGAAGQATDGGRR
jgi:uncharacterized protein (DUF302 family)